MKDRPVDLCPFCKADLVGEPIPEDERAFYDGSRYWVRKIGITSVEADRITHWKCPDCEGQWERGKNERL